MKDYLKLALCVAVVLVIYSIPRAGESLFKAAYSIFKNLVDWLNKTKLCNYLVDVAEDSYWRIQVQKRKAKRDQ